MELYIVRHGRTVWNKQGLIQGTSDAPLLPEGIVMAQRTGEGLADIKFDAVYSSPLSRAYDTAAVIMKDRGPEIIKEPLLMEMGFGVCEGQVYAPGEQGDPLEGFYDSPDTYKAPEGGESFFDVDKRAVQFLSMVAERHSNNERVLVVAHAAINQAIFRIIDGLEMNELWKHGRQLNCAVTIAELKNGLWEVRDRNRIFYDKNEFYA